MTNLSLTTTTQNPTEITAPIYTGLRRIFNADQLEIAIDNQRDGTDPKTKTREVTESIKELAALIVSQGLLQNLIGYESSKKTKKNKIQICAGGRRLTAIKYAIQEGLLPLNFEITVLIVDEKQGLLMSLAENSGRLDMSPANQFKAFKRAIDAGNSIDEISVAFGVDTITIKRRLKLASIEPSIFAEYEQGTATLDQITALTLTEDHFSQSQVWNSLTSYQKTATNIRRLLTTNEINGTTDPVAQYVTIEAYLAAGGGIRFDLFSDAQYLTDLALLENLAAKKLEQDSAELLQEGWTWIDHHVRIGPVDLQAFEHAKKHTRDMNSDEETERAQLEQAIEQAQDKLDEFQQNAEENEESDFDYETEEYVALESKKDQLEESLNLLDEKLLTIDPIAQAFAGTVVTINRNGQLQIHRALIRPDDQKAYKQALLLANNTDSSYSSELHSQSKSKTEHSEKLTRQLTAHRTAALQLLLSKNPNIALVSLTHKLIIDVFTNWGTPHRGSNIQIRLEQPNLEREGECIKTSNALIEFLEKKRQLNELIPTDDEENTIFSWLMKQETNVLMDIMAFCVAASVNTVQSDDAKLIQNIELAQALKLDMTDFWEPTRETYLAQIKKEKIVSIVAEVVSNNVALPIASMKKNDACQAAETALRGKKWLPATLKTHQQGDAI